MDRFPQKTEELARRRWIPIAVVCACLSLAWATAGSCGAQDVNAPFSMHDNDCPSVDFYMADLLGLVDSGEIESIHGFLGDGLAMDQKRALIRTVLDIVGAFEPGAFSDLSRLLSNTDESVILSTMVTDLIQWMVHDAHGAPYSEVLTVGAKALQTCDGVTFMDLLIVLGDEQELVGSLLSLFLSGEGDLASFVENIASAEGDSQAAFRALAHNLLAAAMAQDFDGRVWTDILAGIVDTSEAPWDAVVDGVESFLVPGPSLAAIQTLLQCLSAVDPDLVWVDLLFDLVTATSEDSLVLTGLESIVSPNADADGTALFPPEIAAPLSTLVHFLRDDAPARRSLASVLSSMLASANAPLILDDVGDLLEAGIMGDTMDLFAAVAAQECEL